MTNKILRLPEVTEKTGLSRSSVYLKVSQGEFPKQLALGTRAVGWLETDIEKWIETLVPSPEARSQ